MISRRKFVSMSTAFAFVRPSLGKTFAAGPGRAQRIFIGTANTGPGEGILTASWNGNTGEIGDISLAAEVASPSFLASFQKGSGQTLVFAVSEVSDPHAKVSACTTVAGSSKLRMINQVETQGSGPTFVSVSPDGHTVLVANYVGGSVTSFRVKADGSLSDAVSHFQYRGSGPVKGRQDTPHAHSALPSPDGRFVLVNDLGLDRIMIYRLDSSSATLMPADPPFWKARPASGPRHLAWNPNGRFVYCVNELDSTVDTLAWSEQPVSLESIGHLSTLPSGFAPSTAFAGEIVASSDGRNVYAGNRVADDTIAVFDVDRTTGLLTHAQFASSGGKNSRHITLDPSGRWMVVSHQSSNDLTVLARETGTGTLSTAKHVYPAKKPMCVIFV